ncbi:phage portal protein [bacterium]|nr:phage portal protein [bacterium]
MKFFENVADLFDGTVYRAATAFAMAAKLSGLRYTEADALLGKQFAGRAIWNPQNYRELAKEGYEQCQVVYSAINENAEAFGSVPFFAEVRNSDGTWERAMEHDITGILNQPNTNQSGREYQGTWLSELMIDGNTYQEVSRETTGPNFGRPMELVVRSPQWMKLEIANSGLPGKYVFDTGQGTVEWDIDAVTGQSDIKQTKMFNPLNDYYGLSPIRAAALAVDTWNSYILWNKKLLDNMGNPPFVLKTDERPNPDEVKALEQKFEDKYLATRNAGKPIILTGGLEYTKTAFSPQDMDWAAGEKNTAANIARVLKVPAQVLGIEGSQTYANMEQAMLGFWEKTIFGWIRVYQGAMNGWLVPMYREDNVRVNFDLSDIPALAPRRDTNWNRAKESGDFLSVNERRNIVGYDDRDDGDVILVNSSLIPMSEITSFTVEDMEKERQAFEMELRGRGVDEDQIRRAVGALN